MARVIEVKTVHHIGPERRANPNRRAESAVRRKRLSGLQDVEKASIGKSIFENSQALGIEHYNPKKANEIVNSLRAMSRVDVGRSISNSDWAKWDLNIFPEAARQDKASRNRKSATGPATIMPFKNPSGTARGFLVFINGHTYITSSRRFAERRNSKGKTTVVLKQ
ncbi:MAG: hypothetical protein PHD95_04520 [Candidatus ainarchaeum sp.]|nr:hypothetical protein [Candidatus ainarchaeum sp.]